KRQVPPGPGATGPVPTGPVPTGPVPTGPVPTGPGQQGQWNFQAEYYRIAAETIRKIMEAYTCNAQRLFQDPNPPNPLMMDPEASTTPATVTTSAPTTAPTTAPPAV
ncbi:hypothetical protein BaRGS_00026027, partial [Batillaria attramentaria]